MPDALAIKLLFKSLSQGQIVILAIMYLVSLSLFIASCVKSAGFPRREKIKVMNLLYLISVISMFFSFATLFAMFRDYFTSFWPYFVVYLAWFGFSWIVYSFVFRRLEKRIERRNSNKDVRLHENQKLLDDLTKEKEKYGTNVGLGS